MQVITTWLIAISVTFVSAFSRLGDGVQFHDPSTGGPSVNADVFMNYLDHFDHFNHTTFAQRYWYTTDFWDKRGPILLYICAEGPGGFPAGSSFILTIAKELKAAVVALEHRFYGQSVPFRDLSLDNLRFLSHDQSLADTAYFIRFFKRKLETESEVPLKLFVTGGSYAGALAAWMRLKYPYLVDGAWASSGVVNAILDFHAFDQQVRRSALKSGPKCTERIEALLKEVRELWNENPWQVKLMYGAPFMEWDDFMFYFADLFAIGVQYGSRTKMCGFLETIVGAPDRHSRLARFAATIGVQPSSYAFEYLRTQHSDPLRSERQWTYQFCSTLGYLNTPAKKDPLRFKDMDLEYWKRYCQKCFDAPVFPDTFHTNSLYSDTRIEEVASNIIFTNGGEDPWQWAGITV